MVFSVFRYFIIVDAFIMKEYFVLKLKRTAEERSFFALTKQVGYLW